MKRPKRDSQMWPFLYWVTGLVALTAILWLTASDFDQTEGRAIAGTGAATAGAMFIIEVLRRKIGGES
jgi:hypothetical protein